MLVVVASSLIASAGFWATMQLIITRKGRTAEAARVAADTERIKQEAASGDVARQKLISEVSDAALRAADSRYAHLHDDYDEVKSENKEQRAEIRDQRAVIATLVDVFGVLVFRMRVAPDGDDLITLKVSSQEFLASRAALDEARIRLR